MGRVRWALLMVLALPPRSVLAMRCGELTTPQFDVTRFTVDGHALRQQFLKLDAAGVGTVTSSRQERRKVVELTTLDRFLDTLKTRLGPKKVVARDLDPVETDTDYRLKFRGLNSRGERVFKWDLRWRVYREIVEGSPGAGRPKWEIMSDEEGEYGKLEIKRPGFRPGIFEQRLDDIRKTSAVFHKTDYLALMGATPKTFPKIGEEAEMRAARISKNGKPANQPSEVHGLIDTLGWAIEHGLSLRDPVTNVKYIRTALKLYFTYSKSQWEKLLQIKNLESQVVRVWAAAPGERRSAETEETLRTIRDEKARLRSELRSTKLRPLDPGDTEVFEVDLTMDRNVVITDLKTGVQVTSPRDHRTLEFKTSVLAIADLTDEELLLIGADDYRSVRSLFFAMDLAPNTPTDTGKRSVARQAAELHRIEDDDF